MPHSHWPEGLRERLFVDPPPAPVCRLKKTECDKLWTWYLHRHEGKPCEKRVLPGNKTATCVLAMTPEQLEERLSRRVKERNENGPKHHDDAEGQSE